MIMATNGTYRRRFGAFAGLALAAALGLAACGGAGATGGGLYGGGGSSSSGGGSSTASGGSVNLQCASGAAVCTKTVTVSGKSVTALADTKGMTLYYFTPDSASSVTCTGSCAQTWPPLSASGSVSGAGLSGMLTTVSGANGSQVEYNGHPLYRYASDASQSDVKGEGIFGKWFVATSDLAAGSGAAPASASPTTTPSNGGYGAGGY
jgi:predicted lipoprotein with Yx(FWY)xxD motif